MSLTSARVAAVQLSAVQRTSLISHVRTSQTASLLAADTRLLQVRKKADGAKDPVRQFISKWKDNDAVQKSPALTETREAIEELGQYYMRRGTRVALDRATADSIVKHLDRAEAALPAEEAKSGFLGGLFK